METSHSELSEREHFRLRDILRDMSIPLLHRFAEKYGIEIPYDTPDIFTMVDTFIDGLSPKAMRRILADYGDAGRKSTYVFVSKEKTPPIKDVFQKANALLEIEPESQFWENYPYYDEVDIDHTNRTLKIRFHYLKGVIYTLDESGTQREQRLHHSAVVAYRPESRVLEIRARHKSMANKMALRIPVHLGLAHFVSLNLMDEKLIRAFVDWISSLNSATIELPISDVAGSIRITARKGLDLRTAERFNEELRYGRLRGGHVTIEPKEGQKINFRIFFRDCHVKYTLFTSEEEISYVLDAIEKIAEGYKFVKRDKVLEEFFGKEN